MKCASINPRTKEVAKKYKSNNYTEKSNHF